MYGNIFKYIGGTALKLDITCDTLATVLANPKNIDAPNIPNGFHYPKINAANAKKPSPETVPLNSP